MKYSTHFGDARKEYMRFRPQYPPALFEKKKEHYITSLIESVEKSSNQKIIDVDFGLELVLAVK